ncbi:MAG: hypothetical protein IRY87_32260 [Acetobacteraceae bacterium]|nr:hypothetical protein [Acetobacteraceae bacterium]
MTTCGRPSCLFQPGVALGSRAWTWGEGAVAIGDA